MKPHLCRLDGSWWVSLHGMRPLRRHSPLEIRCDSFEKAVRVAAFYAQESV